MTYEIHWGSIVMNSLEGYTAEEVICLFTAYFPEAYNSYIFICAGEIHFVDSKEAITLTDYLFTTSSTIILDGISYWIGNAAQAGDTLNSIKLGDNLMIKNLGELKVRAIGYTPMPDKDGMLIEQQIDLYCEHVSLLPYPY